MGATAWTSCFRRISASVALTRLAVTLPLPGRQASHFVRGRPRPAESLNSFPHFAQLAVFMNYEVRSNSEKVNGYFADVFSTA